MGTKVGSRSVNVVVVTADSPQQFYVLPEELLKFEEELQEKVQSGANNQFVPSEVEPGKLYIAQRPKVNKWYRVLVTKINKNLTYEVNYIDFGRFGTVTSVRTCNGLMGMVKSIVLECSLVNSEQLNLSIETKRLFKFLVSDR